MNERGQTMPLLALLVLLTGGIAVALIRFGATAAHLADAQTAADAAALAGAAEGRAAADELASANGATIDSYAVDGGDVDVRVRVADGWARARARRAGGGGMTGWVGTESTGGRGAALSPALRRALADAAELLHQPVPVADGSGRWVAVPGTFAPRLAGIAARVGLCRQPSRPDPVRFALCPASPT
jgi:hypothetical protein